MTLNSVLSSTLMADVGLNPNGLITVHTVGGQPIILDFIY